MRSPDAYVFATNRSKRSDRPLETVKPLAKALKLGVNDNYGNDAYPKLAEELLTNPKYAGKTILVCWHHGKIPELVEALGASGVPKHWKDDSFDRVWVVTFDEKG